MKLGPWNCTNSVSMKDSMDCFDDIQIEELQNFDFVGEDLIDLIEEENDFNMKEYLNGNYDYWLWLPTLLILLETPLLILDL